MPKKGKMKAKINMMNFQAATLLFSAAFLLTCGVLFSLAYGLHWSVSLNSHSSLYRHSGGLPVDATNFRLLWREKFR
jgi:hypothetical protein